MPFCVLSWLNYFFRAWLLSPPAIVPKCPQPAFTANFTAFVADGWRFRRLQVKNPGASKFCQMREKQPRVRQVYEADTRKNCIRADGQAGEPKAGMAVARISPNPGQRLRLAPDVHSQPAYFQYLISIHPNFSAGNASASHTRVKTTRTPIFALLRSRGPKRFTETQILSLFLFDLQPLAPIKNLMRNEKPSAGPVLGSCHGFKKGAWAAAQFAHPAARSHSRRKNIRLLGISDHYWDSLMRTD